MALVHFDTFRGMDQEPPHPDAELMEYRGERLALWIWRTHVGLCLKEREMNGYHDSDFYMTIWDEEKGAPFEVCFATTRGWTYPCYGSNVDATPEVRAKYEAWMEAERAKYEARMRKDMAAKLRALRAMTRKNLGTGETFLRAMKLRRKVGPEKFKTLVTFMGRNVRSPFKKSLREQVEKWFADPAPKFERPLSPRQWECL